jgi:LacI family transcriptional regulator
METRPVTIRDVAKKAGVSVSTVSRALNNYSDISETTRDLILKIAEEIGYKANIAAKSLSSNKNFRLGMLVEDYESSGAPNPLVFEILMGFKNAATKQGYEMVLLTTTSDIQKTQNLSKLFSEKQIDGIFILGLKMTDDYYKSLNTINFPCVLYDISIQNPYICCVGVDNIKGAFMAVNYLIELGHKKIGFINGHKEAFVSYERLDGYYLALNRNNIAIDNSLIINGDFEEKAAEKAAIELIEKHKDLTAIFCASDIMAIGAINGLSSLGYAIPDDVSIIGFDDIYLAQYMIPKLTTIRQNRTKIGEMAANILINLSSGQTIGRVVTEPELIIRESTKRLV